jgi:hypothetical protein
MHVCPACGYVEYDLGTRKEIREALGSSPSVEQSGRQERS